MWAHFHDAATASATATTTASTTTAICTHSHHPRQQYQA